MKKCNKCNIEFNGNIKYCPLCQNKLTNFSSPNVFPPNIKRQKDTILFKILLFVSIVMSIISIFLEYIITKKFNYSFFVTFGLITNMILLLFILENYQNVLKMMAKYFYVILTLLFIWYFATKNLIITTFIIPGLCIVIYLFNGITMIVLKNYYITKYTGIILFDAIIGLIPMLLVFLNLTTINILAYICFMLDIFIFLALIIFCKQKIFNELKKMFSI